MVWFQLGCPHLRLSYREEKKDTYTLKVIVASLRRTDGDKPHFDVVDTIYIAITEATANQPFILAAVKDNVGDEHVIVAANGYEIKESSGTEGICLRLCIRFMCSLQIFISMHTGFRFWKSTARKIYSVPKDHLCRPTISQTPVRETKQSRSFHHEL